MKNLPLILVIILVSVAGCQTGQSVQTAAIDNGSFMSLWNTYSHCHTTTDIDELRESASTLTNAANRSLTQDAFVLPLPGKLEKLVSTPSVRFAVDVKAVPENQDYPFSVHARKSMRLSVPDMRELSRRFTEMVGREGGRYDGWAADSNVAG